MESRVYLNKRTGGRITLNIHRQKGEDVPRLQSVWISLNVDQLFDLSQLIDSVQHHSPHWLWDLAHSYIDIHSLAVHLYSTSQAIPEGKTQTHAHAHCHHLWVTAFRKTRRHKPTKILLTGFLFLFIHWGLEMWFESITSALVSK